MKSIRKNRVALAVLAALLLALSGTAAVAYANGGCPTIETAREAATEQHFHLWTDDFLGLYLDEGQLRVHQDYCSITGNLMTFTHPNTPNSVCIGDWEFENRVGPNGRGTISGSFKIDVGWTEGFPNGFWYGPATGVKGKIHISFHGMSFFVPKIHEDCDEPDHYNFQGTFRITGSSSVDGYDNFYEGITGSGTIGGTFHDHDRPDGVDKWFDFVMIGTAGFRGRP
jgi:hypothetical protein